MTAGRSQMNRKPSCLLLLLGAVTLLLAGCGGSSKSSTSAVVHVVTHPVNARKARERKDAPTDRVASAVHVHQPRSGTGSGEVNDDNPGHADTGGHLSTVTLEPCKLVSASQAGTIVGGPVGRPVEAPLGPTCIYHSLRDGRVVTMSVEAANFTRIKQYLRGIRSLRMAGYTAYCGTYGQPTTVVPLGRGRVLQVTAPCVVGFRFAATALPRLAS
jgi:hypothetical protein